MMDKCVSAQLLYTHESITFLSTVISLTLPLPIYLNFRSSYRSYTPK